MEEISEEPMKEIPETIKEELYPIHLQSGKYYFFCTCGKSRRKPYCDGNHSGTGRKPLQFRANVSKEHTIRPCNENCSPHCQNTYLHIDW